MRSQEQILSAYSVRWVLDRRTIANLKAKRQVRLRAIATVFHVNQPEGRTLIVRSYFNALMTVEKSLHETIVIEAPILEGLRTQEVCTLRMEYIDYDRLILHVLDSKKHVVCPLSLDPTFALHLRECTEGRSEGYVLQREVHGGAQPRDPDAPLTHQAVISTWWRLCDRTGIPRMSPRMGRAYFAFNYHVVEGKSLMGLMVQLRHTEPKVTQSYIDKIACFEDYQAEFLRGKLPFIDECMQPNCGNRIPNCKCGMFLSKNVEVKT